MGKNALFTIGAQVTHPNGSETACTAFTGDSLTIAPLKDGVGKVYVHDIFVHAQAVAVARFKAAKNAFHNKVNGLTFYIQAATVESLIPRGELLEVMPGDLVTPSINAASSAGDITNVIMNMWAQGGHGIEQNLISYNEYRARKQAPINLYTTVTAGTAAGYGGDQAFTSFTINDVEPTDKIAVLGVTSTVLQGAVTIKGPDTGSQDIAYLANVDYSKTQDYALRLAMLYPDEPLILVLTGTSLAKTYVRTVNNENAASPIVTIRGRRIV